MPLVRIGVGYLVMHQLRDRKESEYRWNRS